MKKKHPSIQFSLPSAIHEQLEAFAQDGESINLVVKRIFYQGLEAITGTFDFQKPIERDWKTEIEQAIEQLCLEQQLILDRLNALELKHAKHILDCGTYLLKQVKKTNAEIESQRAAVDKVIENSSQPSATENLEPPNILKSLHGIVLVKDKKVKKFWNGRQFVDHPGKIKIFKRSPNEKTMTSTENRVIPGSGDAKTNDLASILEHMGYPYRFESWDTKAIARLWADSNLIQE